MRDAETGAWRGRGKAGSPASPLLGGDGPRPNLSGAHGQKQTTTGGNVGLEFEDANYFHARNQPSSPSRHKPPTRALPLSFLSLFSVFSIVHPTRRSARGGPGNSTTCSMLPPGDATSPALDCTSTTCVEFFCDLHWRGPSLYQMSASETNNLGARVFIPAESETLAPEQSSFCCVSSLLELSKGNKAESQSISPLLSRFSPSEGTALHHPQLQNVEMPKWHPDGRCRLHNAGSSAHIVYTAENLGDGRYMYRGWEIYIQGMREIYTRRKEEGKKKERKGKC